MQTYLAIDLGAESGRVIAATLDGGRLSLEEIHRFPNQPVWLPNGLYWDSLRLFHEITEGLCLAGRRGLEVQGVGVDTWGVDFALFDGGGEMVEVARSYRDPRNNGMLEKTFEVIPRETIFAETGIQFMSINTLYQLHALQLAGTRSLSIANCLLMMPDIFNYWLSGQQRNEVTIASTSQIYNPAQRDWSWNLINALQLPRTIFGSLVQPGERIGELTPFLAKHTGLGAVPVYAVASHDTASAVAAVPAEGDDWCYISSGTWSLMGVELPEPVINEQTLALNYTNEVGAAGRIRLLKNIAGLWPLQECRRAWAREGSDYTYEQLVAMAETAQPDFAIIDPDEFLDPGDMPRRIAQRCRDTSQRVPETPGQMTRVILESLARKYAEVLANLEIISGRTIRRIHIVGGGSRNRLLNRLVAQYTGRTIIAGPTEAAAAGNAMVQALGAGVIRSLEEGRELVRRSWTLETIEPTS